MSVTYVFNGTIEKGRTWTISVQWLLDGVPVDLTGQTLRAAIAESGRLPIMVLTSTASNGVLITDPTNGKFTISLTPTQTTSLPDSCILEVSAVSGSQDVNSIFRGLLTVEETIPTS